MQDDGEIISGTEIVLLLNVSSRMVVSVVAVLTP